jgi:hypothetical protein
MTLLMEKSGNIGELHDRDDGLWMHTMIDNIFINKFKNANYSVSSLNNGLSDHDAQVLSLFNIIVPDDRNEFYSYRKISKHLLNEFQTSLSYETW